MDDRDLWPSEDEGFARSLIQNRARRLLSAAHLPITERDEFEQQLTVELWLSSRSFDSARGTWHGFATAAVSHAGTKILRNRFAQRRDDRSTTSISTTVIGSTGEPTELNQTVSEHERANHRGIDPLPAQVHADLSMDLAQHTATLPVVWQDVISLCRTYTTSEIVERTGIKRSTLTDLKRKIRKRLKKKGFEEYLET